jgi:predicted ATP-binding protein involved in virulence
MNHTKVVDAVKAQREIVSNALAEISSLKGDAFDAIEAEKQAIKEYEQSIKERIKREKQALKEQTSQLRESINAVLSA